MAINFSKELNQTFHRATNISLKKGNTDCFQQREEGARLAEEKREEKERGPGGT